MSKNRAEQPLQKIRKEKRTLVCVCKMCYYKNHVIILEKRFGFGYDKKRICV